MIRALAIALMMIAISSVLLGSSAGERGDAAVIPFSQPPSGYVHRPVLEFFTGLSCPSCMGESPDADSPEKAVHDNYLQSMADPSMPFTTVIFHELNGGGEDALRTEESEERMRYYQPGMAGTPDVEIDGGYIEIGGFSTSQTPITEETVSSALVDAGARYNDKPIRPIDRLSWSFPYLKMEVREIYQGDGSFFVEVNATYLSNAKTVGAPQLRGSLYIFMVEDNVTAKSKVYEDNGIEDFYVRNDAVFRGYAVADEQFTLSVRNEFYYSGSWTIPDSEVPIKPQDVYAVAAIYDTSDTSSGGSDSNKKANSPRCVQSATSRSTAYDRGNEASTVSTVTLEDGTVTVAMADDGGIAAAYVFYTTEVPELPEVPSWTGVELEVTGEEICDDAGVCYAYSDPVGTAAIEGDPVMLQVLMYDDQGIQSSSAVYSFGTGGGVRQKDSSMGSIDINAWGVVLILGILLIIAGPALYFSLRKRKGFLSTKASMALFLSVGIIASAYSVYAMSANDTDTVPSFSVTDTKGQVRTDESYEGKVLVIDIMFADCSFCNKEMPDVVSVYEYAKEKYKGKVEFLSVSIEKKDTNEKLDAFQEKYGAEWPIAKDPTFIQKFDALSVPKMVIVAPNGEISYTHKGVIDKEDVKDAIDSTVSGDYSALSIGQRGSSLLFLMPLAAGFGILTFFSPCSFPMLPGYLSYYVANDLKREGRKGNPVKGGIFAALGIVSFFLIIGLFVALFGAVVQRYLFNLMPVVGLILLMLGLSILLGFDHYLERLVELVKRPFQRSSSRSTDSGGAFGLFAYGFGYGAASSSCMAPLFIAVMLLGLSTGLIGGGLIFTIYALSLGAMMVAISLLVSSSEKLITKLVSSMGTIKKVSGGLLVLTGIFVVWYFFAGYKVFSGFLSF